MFLLVWNYLEYGLFWSIVSNNVLGATLSRLPFTLYSRTNDKYHIMLAGTDWFGSKSWYAILTTDAQILMKGLDLILFISKTVPFIWLISTHLAAEWRKWHRAWFSLTWMSWLGGLGLRFNHWQPLATSKEQKIYLLPPCEIGDGLATWLMRRSHNV